jgi:hypothetical protein
VKRLILLFAALGVAIAIVGLVVAGDELLIENQRADAQIATRPNFVFVMTDDLDELSMKQLYSIQAIMEPPLRTPLSPTLCAALVGPPSSEANTPTTTASPATSPPKASRSFASSGATSPPWPPGLTNPDTRQSI